MAWVKEARVAPLTWAQLGASISIDCFGVEIAFNVNAVRSWSGGHCLASSYRSIRTYPHGLKKPQDLSGGLLS